jgi:LPS export ABC transporter protein LptC
MGRTFKLLFSLIIFNFLFYSFSFPFKIISHDLKYAFYKRERLIWSFKIRDFVQEENGNFKGKGIYIINKEKGLEIWADKGFYKKREDKFLLENNVRLITSEYGEVITQELIFYPKKNLIFTDKEVLVIKKDIKIKGVGLIYDVETGNFKVKEKAKVKLKL